MPRSPTSKPSRHPGRAHVVQRGEPHETQAVLMTGADVVNWPPVTRWCVVPSRAP